MPTKQNKILLVIDDDLLKEVERFRFDRWIPSRSEAIRQLIKKGLDMEVRPDDGKDRSKDE